jgi:hypothetical protein
MQIIPFSSQILINLQLFRNDLKNRITDLLKIQRKASCSMQTDGQIDMKMQIAAFPSFYNTPKI